MGGSTRKTGKEQLKQTRCFGIITKLEFYKGVLTVFDLDLGERLREVVDRIDPIAREDLLVVYEWDASLTMIWKEEISTAYSRGTSIQTTYPNGQFDYWQIEECLTLQQVEWGDKILKLKEFHISPN